MSAGMADYLSQVIGMKDGIWRLPLSWKVKIIFPNEETQPHWTTNKTCNRRNIEQNLVQVSNPALPQLKNSCRPGCSAVKQTMTVRCILLLRYLQKYARLLTWWLLMVKNVGLLGNAIPPASTMCSAPSPIILMIPKFTSVLRRVSTHYMDEQAALGMSCVL